MLLSAQFLLLTNLQRKLTQDGINHPTEFSLSMQYPGYDVYWIANGRRGKSVVANERRGKRIVANERRGKSVVANDISILDTMYTE